MADKISPIGSEKPVKPISATKPTQSTTTTTTVSSVGGVRPISQTRINYNYDITDSFYKKTELAEPIKEKKIEPKTTYSWYSSAQFMPSTPITQDTVAKPGGSFSEYMTRFSGFESFMEGLSSFIKPDEKMVWVNGPGGQGFIPESALKYADRYIQYRDIDYIKKIAEAEKIVENRNANPNYAPLIGQNLPDGYEFYDNIGRLAGKISVSKDELDMVRKIAIDNNLGQRGYDELVDKFYKAKVSYIGYDNIMSTIPLIEDPSSASWNDAISKFAVMTRPKIGDIPSDANISEILSKQSSLAAVNPAISEVSNRAIAAISKMLGMPSFGAGGGSGEASVIGAVAAALKGALDHWRRQEIRDHQFEIFRPDGTLRTTFRDLTEVDQRMVSEIADRLDAKHDDIVAALAYAPVVSLAKSLAWGFESLSKAQSDIATDSFINISADSPGIRLV